MKVCAVIPAAGLGLRLGLGIPKLLVPLTASETVWTVLRRKLLTVCDHIHIIVSPNGESQIRAALDHDIKSGLVSLSLQHKPVGMGDAIFCGYAVWSKADTIIIVWGDQVFVSENTLKKALMIQGGASQTMALPLTSTSMPYVEYVFDNNHRLIQVKQTREGDVCSSVGLADVGTFVLSVENLFTVWQMYLAKSDSGANTKEINFLPFLPYLAACGWRVCPVNVEDSTEARGINTRDDLIYFQALYEGVFT